MRRSRGFSVLAAIFILVILAALAAVIASITGIQQSSTQLDMLGVHAYQAARSGLEVGVERVLDPRNTLNLNLATCNSQELPPCPASQHLTGLSGSLAPFTVSVTCNLDQETTEGTRKLRVYTVTASACNKPGGGPPAACPNSASTANDYVSREVQAIVSNCKDKAASPPRCTCG